MSNVQIGILVITVLFGVMRAFGSKGNVYKALAHCWVGFLFGAWYMSGDTLMGVSDFSSLFRQADFFMFLALGLTAIEVAAFFVTRVLKQ
jgi:hypothetical protein